MVRAGTLSRPTQYAARPKLSRNYSRPSGILKRSLSKRPTLRLVLNMKIYTLQTNKFGNLIVCGDEVARNTYRIIFTGSYAECMARKFSNVAVGA